MTDPAQIGAEMLATLSNAILKLDPLSEPKLRELEGRSVRLDVELPGRSEPMSWLMSFAKAGERTASPRGQDGPRISGALRSRERQ